MKKLLAASMALATLSLTACLGPHHGPRHDNHNGNNRHPQQMQNERGQQHNQQQDRHPQFEQKRY